LAVEPTSYSILPSWYTLNVENGGQNSHGERGRRGPNPQEVFSVVTREKGLSVVNDIVEHFNVDYSKVVVFF